MRQEAVGANLEPLPNGDAWMRRTPRCAIITRALIVDYNEGSFWRNPLTRRILSGTYFPTIGWLLKLTMSDFPRLVRTSNEGRKAN